MKTKGTNCIVCYTEPVPVTRTAFRGSMKYLKRALVEGLGIEEVVADNILSHSRKKLKLTNNPHAPLGVGMKGRGVNWYEMSVTLCRSCAEPRNLQLGTEEEGIIPCYEET